MKEFKINLFNDFSDIPLEKELPVRISFKNMKILGWLALFFGGSFVLIPIAFLIKSLVNREPISDALPVLVIAALFSPLMITGINLLKRKKELIIKHDSISENVSSLFKKEQWEEPITNYHGLLLRTDIQLTGERSSRMIYLLELLHPNPKRNIPLFKNYHFKTILEKWNSYCQLFNTTPLEKTGKDKWFRRETGNLDTPMIDLIKQGKLEMNLQPTPPSTPPPNKITLQNTKDGEKITFPKTVIQINKNQLVIDTKGFLEGQKQLLFKDIGGVIIDYSLMYKKWAWAVVITERNHTRHILAHDFDYELLQWLQTHLIKRLTGEPG